MATPQNHLNVTYDEHISTELANDENSEGASGGDDSDNEHFEDAVSDITSEPPTSQQPDEESSGTSPFPSRTGFQTLEIPHLSSLTLLSEPKPRWKSPSPPHLKVFIDLLKELEIQLLTREEVIARAKEIVPEFARRNCLFGVRILAIVARQSDGVDDVSKSEIAYMKLKLDTICEILSDFNRQLQVLDVVLQRLVNVIR